MPKCLRDISIQRITSMLQTVEGIDKIPHVSTFINECLTALTDFIFPKLLETSIDEKIEYIGKLGLRKSMFLKLLEKVQLAETEWTESLLEAQEHFYTQNDSVFYRL